MAKHGKRVIVLLFCLVFCIATLSVVPWAAVTKADTQAFTPYAITNDDFEQPLDGNQIPGWGSWTQVGSVGLDARAHSGNHSLNLTNGFIAAWNSSPAVNLSQVNSPHPGDLVQASVWVQVPDTSTDLSIKPFGIWVQEVDSGGNKHMIASAQLPVDAARGQWFKVTTSPVDGGIIQSSTQNLVVSFQDYVTGTVLLDDFQVGYLDRGLQPPSQVSKPTAYSSSNPSFEDGLSGWGTWASSSPIIVAKEGYYGNQSVQLENPTAADSSAMWQTIPAGTDSGQAHVGDTVEAGAWVKLLPDASPAPGKSLKLQVEGVNSDGTKSLLAQSADLSTLPAGVWTYVLTQPISSQTVTSGMSGGVVVSVQDALQGGVLIDFVQCGQANSLTGAPQKFVIGEYQPWYGATGRWHNWEWKDNNGIVHNPDNVLPNGQRDISAYYYPLVGAYDSTDSTALQYHVDLMKAMGVDCILVDWYAGLEKDDVQSFNKLLEIADKSDMKVAIFYEPKIHTFGWIPYSSRQDQINSITQDITSYIDQYSNHKAVLKVRGRPVVGVFGATNTGLTSTDWASILQTVHNEKYNPYMIGDVAATDPPSSFDGMMNWVLYQDALASNNTYSYVESFSEQINATSAKWAATDPVHRIGVGMVWPGFNDSGVDGWGAGPRVIPYSQDFYNAAWDGMLKQNLDWVVIATFNDFTESTAIEPSRELGYSRAITTSQYITKFKGTQAITDPKVYRSIAQEYDHTAPAISVSQPAVSNDYLDDKTLIVNYSLSDDQSGVKTSETQSTLDGGAIKSGTSIELYTLPLGVHTLTVSGSDWVGNTATKTVTFQTTTSIASLEQLVQLFASCGAIDSQGIANSLEQKLHNNDVRSFVNEVEAQSGKHIQTTQANYLLRDGQWLLNN